MDAIASGLFVSFLWGLAPVIHKSVLQNVDFRVVMVIGGLFYAVCLVVFALWHRQAIFHSKALKTLTWKSVSMIAFAAIATAFIANLIYFYVLKKHDSYVVSALIYSAPVFTALLAMWLLGERISVMGGVGVLLIVLGIVCLSMNETRHHRGSP